jgi:ribonuclease Z
MPPARTFSEIRLVNGSTGDPVLFIDYPGKDDAYLFDAGDLTRLADDRLADLRAVFITHHHMDHFVGFDRILRANLDRDKVLPVFGPADTIRRIHARVTSYEHPCFPFQKLALQVHEVWPDRMRVALLECAKHFPVPKVEQSPWCGPTIYEHDDLKVEAAHADHSVPCLSFALVERKGYHPDPVKLAGGVLRPGAWVNEALVRLRAGAAEETVLEIEGGRFTLGALAAGYFAEAGGGRVTYITDTAWSEASRPGLLKLAGRANRLYCDSYYALAQAKQAAIHRHMTATQAAELAKLAKVDELVLIHFAARYVGRYADLLGEARALFLKTTAEIPRTASGGR